MGLSKLVKKVTGAVKAVAPIAAMIPGPIGLAGMAVTALSSVRGAAPAPAPQLPQAAFDLGMSAASLLPAALPGGAPIQMASLPSLGGMAARVLPALGAGARVVGRLVMTAAGKIRGVMLEGGRFLSSKKAVRLAKSMGIQGAATALGIGAVEMAQMVMDDAERSARRRGRGISARDIRVARRTIRTVKSLHAQIVDACRPVMPRRSFGAARKPAACPPVRLISVKK